MKHAATTNLDFRPHRAGLWNEHAPVAGEPGARSSESGRFGGGAAGVDLETGQFAAGLSLVGRQSDAPMPRDADFRLLIW